MKRVDLDAYQIQVQPAADGSGPLFATVQDLPGCFAVANSAADLNSAVEQAIILHLDDHPEAPARFLR